VSAYARAVQVTEFQHDDEGLADAGVHWACEVLDFWFDELSPKQHFGGGPQVDHEIAERFGMLVKELTNHSPDPARLTTPEIVAAIIALDQFSRNIHRGSPETFGGDAGALRLARYAIDGGLDGGIPDDWRQFVYMPFMHSESREDQDRSVMLFRALGNQFQLRFALGHQKIIERFGRFPHRNALLGRPSREDEEAYLAERDGRY
jgi:uncharacterized protein (DUF924 family)